MGKKRTRPGKSRGPTASSQSTTTGSARFKCPKSPVARTDQPTHPVISLYYRELLTLRQYLLHQLPVSSKLRRRRIASLGASRAETGDEALVALLDSTLVGVLKQSTPQDDSDRQRDYRAFTQSQSRSILASTDTGPVSPQSEVVDFVIEQLFKRNGPHQWPQHLLMHGFQRPSMGQNAIESNIPGIVIQFPNRNVWTLKQPPWANVLGLLGQNGDEIMMRLLFDCGIYAPIDAARGVFYQLSGLPLSSLDLIAEKDPITSQSSKSRPNQESTSRNVIGPNSILFLRRRMLYSRLASTSREAMRSGLGRSHVLNRMSSLDSSKETVHVMKYIFPKQFGLQNVFSVTSDGNDQFKGDLSRENEISALNTRNRLRRVPSEGDGLCEDDDTNVELKLPKRLRGQAMELTKRLRVRHARCRYNRLLEYYCPEPNGPWKLNAPSLSKSDEPASTAEEKLVTQLPAKSPSSAKLQETSPRTKLKPASSETLSVSEQKETRTKKPKLCLTDYATPASSVSAFCRAVLQNVLPLQFFGEGSEGLLNRKIVLKHVDSFIKLRRFENLSLREVCNGLKVTGIPWLASARLRGSSDGTKNKMSLSDFQKRTELMHEFVYYLFDSIVIPIIRTNFYVTESQTHRNRLFYFRHDVWARLTEQPFADLKANMFEEIEPKKAEQILARRSLGFGSLRLLPKSTGLRPILNLRKRVRKEAIWNGKKRVYQASSVNTAITPIYNMLNYERTRDPSTMGSSLYSVGDMHPRLKDFKTQLAQPLPPTSDTKSHGLPPLYFVKLDIQACFDTIPQTRLLKVIDGIVSEQMYHITRHVELHPSAINSRGKTSRNYAGRAAPAMKQQHLKDIIAEKSQVQSAHTVLIDTIAQKAQDAGELLDLLDEHVQNNLLKMGKTFYRQRKGIPQGSVLSSLLCNFFYAKLEREVLEFLQPATSLLLRLVDDFLLITTDMNQATQFLDVMIHGQPSYGVSVNPAKSMANFTAAVDGIHIPRLEGTALFPYCGSLIDIHTLEIHRDQDRLLEGGDSAAATLSDTLTVETSRLPGRAFHRKMLGSFRLQVHSMYLDGSHNSRAVVLTNLYIQLITAAMKMYRYMKSLRGRAQPGPAIIIRTIRDMISQTARMIQARRKSPTTSLSCCVQMWHLQYLASVAFRFVLQRKQTRYAPVLHWLDSLEKESRPTTNADAVRLRQVVKRGTGLFEDWRF